MTPSPEQLAIYEFPELGPGPLPAGFEPELRVLDVHLREQAERAYVPADLSDSVYDASVDLLPRPVRRPAATWIRSSLPMRRPQLWGRLAMAASLGLAFVVASLFMRGPALPLDPPQDAATVLVEMDWLATDPRDPADDRVAYLLETGELSSLDELTGELLAILGDFEM